MKRLLFFLGLICFSVGTWASDVFLPLDTGWKFHQSKNPSLHYQDIQNNQWQTLSKKKLQANPTYGMYGWFKVVFNWQQPVNSNLAIYAKAIRHADEVWLNGILIGKTGVISTPWKLASGNPQNMPRNYPLPANVLKKSNNTLAIKLPLGIGESWASLLPGGAGLHTNTIFIVSKQQAASSYIEKVLNIISIDTALVILGLIDIFIIIFLFKKSIRQFDEFWWLLASSVVMLIGSTLLLDFFYILNLRTLINHNILLFVLFISPFITIMYFWSIYKNISKPYLLSFAILWFILSIIILAPDIASTTKNYVWLTWAVLSMLSNLYLLYSAITGIKSGKIGSVTLLLGLVVYMISIRTQWLPDGLFENRNLVIGSLVFRYALLYSYFQRINQMSANYKSLSKKMLTTIEDNKQAIARDLHDDLGQHLSAAKLHLLLCDQKESKQAVDFIKQEIDASVHSIRDIMQGLHPIILEQYSIKEALQKEADRLSNLHTVPITLHTEDLTLTKDIEKHLFRIFQETVNNAISHGKATQIHLKIYTQGQTLYFSVHDNGIGFEILPTKSTNHGFGLVSLKERVGLMNGQMNTQSKKNNGTTVTITIPLT